MASGNCPECGSLVASSASSCPKCGNYNFTVKTDIKLHVCCRKCNGAGEYYDYENRNSGTSGNYPCRICDSKGVQTYYYEYDVRYGKDYEHISRLGSYENALKDVAVAKKKREEEEAERQAEKKEKAERLANDKAQGMMGCGLIVFIILIILFVLIKAISSL